MLHLNAALACAAQYRVEDTTAHLDEAAALADRAERLAPQLICSNPFVRETVANLLRQARRDAGGRELRGLAWRMGVIPLGEVAGFPGAVVIDSCGLLPSKYDVMCTMA